MPKHHVHAQDTVTAPPEKVFALFSDHERVGKLLGAPMTRIKDSPESSDPNGVGSVRRVGPPIGGFEETVLVSDPHKRIEYTVSKGGPIKNHIGKIVFEPVGENTQVTYTIDFDSKIPFIGGVIASALQNAIKKGMKKASRLA